MQEAQEFLNREGHTGISSFVIDSTPSQSQNQDSGCCSSPPLRISNPLPNPALLENSSQSLFSAAIDTRCLSENDEAKTSVEVISCGEEILQNSFECTMDTLSDTSSPFASPVVRSGAQTTPNRILNQSTSLDSASLTNTTIDMAPNAYNSEYFLSDASIRQQTAHSCKKSRKSHTTTHHDMMNKKYNNMQKRNNLEQLTQGNGNMDNHHLNSDRKKLGLRVGVIQHAVLLGNSSDMHFIRRMTYLFFYRPIKH